MIKDKLIARANSIWNYFPRWTKIIMAIALASGGIHLVSIISPSFAGFFNYYVAGGVRALMATLTRPLPFSLAEIIILLIPVAFVSLLVIGFKIADNDQKFKRLICALLSGILLFYSLFVWTFATGYRSERLDSRLALDDTEMSTEELYLTSKWLLDQAEALKEEVDFITDGASVMPYGLDEMSRLIGEAMDRAADKYGLFFNFKTKAKPVIFSRVMSHAHITGVYTFFTGESNLNVDFPDYTLPHTAAHEFSHQRGIAREDEANFVAFLICDASDDPYIRYSGYMNMFEYTSSALYRSSPEKYKELIGSASDELRGELRAYNEFFDQYRDSGFSEVAGAVNDATLKLNGTEGSVSYGLVVDLAVAYHATHIKNGK